jgi:hypothetical protein
MAHTRKAANNRAWVVLAVASGFPWLAYHLATKSQADQAARQTPPTFARDVKPVLDRTCVPCHRGQDAMGDLDLSRFKTEKSVVDGAETWIRVLENVRAGHMPPEGAGTLRPEQRSRFVQWVETTLANANCDIREPGRVTIRRLNRTEYNNTVRDLLGSDLRPADDFPSDDVGYGFDNIGDVLSMSPLLMEKVLDAADRLARAAIALPEPKSFKVNGSDMTSTGNSNEVGNAALLFSNGALVTQHTAPRQGPYRVRIVAGATKAGPEDARMAVLINRREVAAFFVPNEPDRPAPFEVPIDLPSGRHRIEVAFTNDHFDPNHADPKRRDRNLQIESVEVLGPLDDQPLPPSHRRLIPKDPPAPDQHRKTAEEALRPLLAKAYRRPPEPAEFERLMALYDSIYADSKVFERAMQVCVQAILSSPHFLFRAETDPAPDKPRALNGYEVASRMSYFLWASMPDDRLFALAANGSLLKPEVRKAEAKRMLADPKARSLSDDFVNQWLQLPRLREVSPDPERFGPFPATLRDAMRTETLLFAKEVIEKDLSLLEFIDGRFTFLNEPLAAHYGIPGVSGGEFRKVTLPDDRRGGVLGHGSILTLTSNPTRTSPVKRGKWVLEQLLGTPPPPPPPGAGDLPDEGKKVEGKTLRERLEDHRKDPACATCHARMDPIGFALDNFDAVGRWRTEDGGLPLDVTGVLPGGERVSGPATLRKVLLSKADLLRKNMANKMLTYAIGRGLRFSDQCFVDEIAAAIAKRGDRFSALIEAVVESEPFLTRGVPTSNPAASKEGTGASTQR